jgi:hypothetical protein
MSRHGGTRPGAGPKPKPEEERHSVSVRVHVPEATAERWRVLAKERGVPVSKLVRDAMAALYGAEPAAESDPGWLDPSRLKDGLCPHVGVGGGCMPRVADGRCIWCGREIAPAREGESSGK